MRSNATFHPNYVKFFNIKETYFYFPKESFTPKVLKPICSAASERFNKLLPSRVVSDKLRSCCILRFLP